MQAGPGVKSVTRVDGRFDFSIRRGEQVEESCRDDTICGVIGHNYFSQFDWAFGGGDCRGSIQAPDCHIY